MSVHAIPADAAQRIGPLCAAHLRAANEQDWEAGTITFYEDLSPDEEAQLTYLIALARQEQPVRRATYDSVRPLIQELRAHRQLGRNAFMALTAADRDRMTYDVQVAQTRILLALLREAE